MFQIQHFQHFLLLMNKYMEEASKVEPYRYHNTHPFEKSIYLSKEGQQIQHPFSHKPTQAKINKAQINPFETLEQSNAFGKDKRLTISRINTKKQESSFWDIFSCCKEATTVQSSEYDDCYVCNRREHQQQQEEDVPYTSIYRLKSRQEKPVQVFYDKLKNHELACERWDSQ